MSEIVTAENLKMDELRKGDIITFLTGEKTSIEFISFDPGDDIYYVKVNETTAFRYDSKGKCEFPSYDIKEVELVPDPDDETVYYVPDVDVKIFPYVEVYVKGAKKPIKQFIAKSIFDLDGLGPFYKGEIIKATIGPVIIANLKKCKGRTVEILKTLKIFCKDEKEAEEELSKFKAKFVNIAEEKANEEEGAKVKSN